MPATSHTWDYRPLAAVEPGVASSFEEVTLMAINETASLDRDVVARERAIKRLKKRRDFYGHLFVYTLVNGVLVAIWAVANVHGFFWPIYPILGWGIGVVLNAWDVYRKETFSEEQIQREIGHLQRRT
jgi:hypothetical protein